MVVVRKLSETHVDFIEEGISLRLHYITCFGCGLLYAVGSSCILECDAVAFVGEAPAFAAPKKERQFL